MSERQKVLESYRDHAWFGRLYRRLSQTETELARDFIQRNGHLAKGDFELAVNRMFLDQPEKPKNWRVIQELLTCANSALK